MFPQKLFASHFATVLGDAPVARSRLAEIAYAAATRSDNLGQTAQSVPASQRFVLAASDRDVFATLERHVAGVGTLPSGLLVAAGGQLLLAHSPLG